MLATCCVILFKYHKIKKWYLDVVSILKYLKTRNTY